MYSLVTLRNRHFLEAARRVVATIPAGHPVSLRYVASAAALEPAPCYYCTFEYALRMLRVLRHGRLHLRNDRRLALWKELDARATRLMERHGYRLDFALANVLAAGHASQFFISPDRAMDILRSAFNHETRQITIL